MEFNLLPASHFSFLSLRADRTLTNPGAGGTPSSDTQLETLASLLKLASTRLHWGSGICAESCLVPTVRGTRKNQPLNPIDGKKNWRIVVCFHFKKSQLPKTRIPTSITAQPTSFPAGIFEARSFMVESFGNSRHGLSISFRQGESLTPSSLESV